MDVRNCKSCGRLFNSLGNQRLCQACIQALEDKFQDVKRYLDDHKNASMDEVSRENDVPVKQIKQWIREERLSFSDSSMEGIDCEKCGKMIRTGRFCEACKKSMTNDLMSAIDRPRVIEPEKKSSRERDRMRFL
ncbi:MAG: flagellar protein [Agathobacter sp.]|nr:flagellar protein [Agathobacter sp.]